MNERRRLVGDHSDGEDGLNGEGLRIEPGEELTEEWRRFELPPGEMLPGEGDPDFAVQAEQFLGEIATHDLLEESSEEVLRELTSELKSKLIFFGVDGSTHAGHEDLLELLNQMDMNEFLIDDLLMYVALHKKQITGNPHAQVHIRDMLELSTTVSDNPMDARSDLLDFVVTNLESFRIPRKDAYRLAQSANDNQARAVRFLGWLLGQEPLVDLKQVVNSEQKGRKGNVTVGALIGLARQELVRKYRIHVSREGKKEYDPRLGYARETYDVRTKELKKLINMSDYIFLGKKL